MGKSELKEAGIFVGAITMTAGIVIWLVGEPDFRLVAIALVGFSLLVFGLLGAGGREEYRSKPGGTRILVGMVAMTAGVIIGAMGGPGYTLVTIALGGFSLFVLLSTEGCER